MDLPDRFINVLRELRELMDEVGGKIYAVKIDAFSWKVLLTHYQSISRQQSSHMIPGQFPAVNNMKLLGVDIEHE